MIQQYLKDRIISYSELFNSKDTERTIIALHPPKQIEKLRIQF